MSKGSWPRPINQKKFDENHQRIDWSKKDPEPYNPYQPGNICPKCGDHRLTEDLHCNRCGDLS